MKMGSSAKSGDNISLETLLQDGNLTPESMEAILLKAIDREELKPLEKQDFAKLAMYEKVLLKIRAQKPLVSGKEDGRERITQFLRSHPVNKPCMPMRRRLVTAFVGIVVLFFGFEVFFQREWLFGKSTDDKQQYIVQGRKIESHLITNGQADVENAHVSVETTSFEEVVKVLGYAPKIPHWVPEGWNMVSMKAINVKDLKRIVITYDHPNRENVLTFDTRTFDDSERARIMLEQNDIGSKFQFDGKTMYALENVDVPGWIWLDNLSVCAIHGPLDNHDMMTLVKSIQ